MQKISLLSLLTVFLFITNKSLAQWTISPAGTTQGLYSVEYASNGTAVWLGGMGGVALSVNSGQNFTWKAGTDLTIGGGAPVLGSFDDLYAISANEAEGVGLFNLSNNQFIYRTVNGGSGWTHDFFSFNSGYMTGIEYRNLTNGIVVGASGLIKKTTNGGSSWTTVTSGTTAYLRDIEYLGGTSYVAVGDNIVLNTTDDGATWSATSVTQSFYSCSFRSGKLFAASTGGGLYSSLNNGLTWTQLNFPDNNLRCVYARTVDTVYAATATDLYVSYSSGLYWDHYNLPNYKELDEIEFFDANNGIAVGETGYVIRTTNGGGNAFPNAEFTMQTQNVCQGIPVGFISTGNPAYSYSWDFGSAGSSLQQSPTITFSNSGAYTVKLVVTGLNGKKDSSTVLVNVQASADVLPFGISVLDDSLCYNQSTDILVSASQIGVTYSLRNGTTQIGSSQTGNGSTLTFSTGALTQSKSFNIRGIKYNSCTSDSFIVATSVTVMAPSTATTFTINTDTICKGDTVLITVANTQPQFNYNWYTSPVFLNNTAIVGNGGTITLPPIIAGGNNFIAYVRTTDIYTGCVRDLPQSYLIRAYNPVASATVSPNPAITGQTVTVTNTSTQYNSFSWNFGAQATPSTATGITPPPVIYSSAFSDSIYFTAVMNNNVCSETKAIPLTVYTAALTTPATVCSMDSVNHQFSLTVSDMSIDRYNNKYVTGYEYRSSFEFTKDFFVVKVDSTGKLLWNFFHNWFDADMNNYGTAVTGDNYGNTYLGMVNNGFELKIHGTRIHQLNHILGFDPDGQLLWDLNSTHGNINDLITTNDGSVFAVGNFTYDTCRFVQGDSSVFMFTKPATDAESGGSFIMQIDNKGRIVKFRAFGRQNVAGVFSKFGITSIKAKLLSNGNILIAGITDSLHSANAFLGNAVLQQNVMNGGYKTIILGEYNPVTNDFVQATSVIGGRLDEITSVTLDNNDNVYICAPVHDVLYRNSVIDNLPLGNFGTPGPKYSLLFKCSLSGNLDWHTHTRYTNYHDLEVVNGSTLIVQSSFRNNGVVYDKNFSSYGVSAGTTSEIIYLKYNLQGLITGIETNTTPANDWGAGIEKDACDNIHALEFRSQSNYGFPANTNTSAFPLKFFVYTNTSCATNCYTAYNSQSLDVAADSVYLNISDPVAIGSRSGFFRVRNMGQVPVTSLSVQYRINSSTPQSLTWNGNIGHGDTAVFQLGTLSLLDDQYNYIDIWVDEVNGVSDMDLGNDTMLSKHTLCTGGLSGVYTLGPNGDFENFNVSTDFLKVCGIQSSVYFDVEPGIYNEQLSIPVIRGSSPADSVTWRSATGDSSSVIVNYVYGEGQGEYISNISTDKYASNFTIQGMTFIRNINTPTGNACMMFNDSCSNISLIGNHFKGLEYSIGDQWLVLIGNAHKNDSIRILNNFMEGGNIGLEYAGCVMQGRRYDIGGKINDNVFYNQAESGAYARWLISPEIHGNLFYDDTSNFQVNRSALFVQDMKGGRITSNVARCLGSQSNFSIFEFQVVTPTAVDTTLFMNNMIIDLDNLPNLYAIYLYQVTSMNIIHNTIYGNVTVDAQSGNLKVYNNYFTHGNYMLSVVNPTSISECDYNAYYKDTTINANVNTISGTPYKFHAWKAQTGFDTHSEFRSLPVVSYSDYHITSTVSPRGRPLPAFNTDIDGDVRSAYIPFVGADEMDLYSDVWPGDANNDNVVNNYDLLPIGLFFGSQGNPRSSISNAWQAWSCNDWGKQFLSANQKFSDCNGSGSIDFDDTLAINYTNYGLTHRHAAFNLHELKTGAPPVYTEIQNQTIAANDTVTMDVYCGTVALPLQNIYNLAMDINLGSGLIGQGWYEISFDSCWLARNGRRIQSGFINPSSGNIMLAVSRITQTDTSGYGKIARIRYVIDPSVTMATDVTVTITGYQAYNHLASAVSLDAIPDTMHITGIISVSEVNGFEGVNIFPNPANDIITVHFSSSERNLKLTVRDLTGRIIYQKTMKDWISQHTIPLHDFAAGNYLLEVQGELKRDVYLFNKQ